MYDPLIVDVFIEAHPHMAPTAISAGQQATTLVEAYESVPLRTLSPLQSIRANAAQTSSCAEFAGRLGECADSRDAIAITAQYVRLLTPATVCAVYLYFEDSDVLRCVHSSGDPDHLLLSLSIRKGERVSGWAAANHRAIANSDAALDLGEIATAFSQPLRATMAGALIHKSRLMGVVTGYSTRKDSFNEDHQYIFEQVLSIASTYFGRREVSPKSSLFRM
jgi:hypothetical protein